MEYGWHVTYAMNKFETGNVVHADDHLFKDVLDETSALLGLPEPKSNVSLLVTRGLALNFMNDITVVNFDGGTIQLATPVYSHEASLYHAATHIAMYEHEMLFASDTIRASFVQKLLDESVAEMVTYLKFGYKNMKQFDAEYANALLKLEITDQLIEQLGQFSVRHIPVLGVEDRFSLEVANEFMNLEAAIGFSEIDAIARLSTFDDSHLKNRQIYNVLDAISIVAQRNAMFLAQSGVDAKRYVESIKENLNGRAYISGLYFRTTMLPVLELKQQMLNGNGTTNSINRGS